MRKSGVLLPVSSLPSAHGIGCFSKEAYEFIDFLKEAGQSLWQILPLGPTGYGDSPYQSFSTFAGNPYFIDLEELIKEGLLATEECDLLEHTGNQKYVDYACLYEVRFRLLRKAFERFDKRRYKDYNHFIKENAFWLEDYTLFMAAKKKMGQKGFNEWEDEGIRLRRPDRIREYRTEFATEIDFYKFQQYWFYRQWFALKAYANEKGISIIGDIPIYVAFDSADTWANPELFQLDDNRRPIAVAGCPPDYFSATGQLWGNPLYRWDYHKKTGYKWWMKRLQQCFLLYDTVRIDHFRGFDEYYSIPYGDTTAEFGHWEKGPGYEFFDVMKKTLGKQSVIAEDLGFLTRSVVRLVKRTGFPGMKIMEFAFDSKEESTYLPHNYERGCVVYTGTHDNDTIKGWYPTLEKEDKRFVKDYLRVDKKKDVPQAMIATAMASVADTVIIPMQDYLELGSEARINTPSTLGDNWKWRMLKGQCTKELADDMHELSLLYKRNQ